MLFALQSPSRRSVNVCKCKRQTAVVEQQQQ